MKIRMYNCYFGDCFRIRGEKDNDLLVDFGILRQALNEPSRNRVFDAIFSDFKNDDIDFLLTHYHEDHYNGAVHIMKKPFSFRDIYIPDIWNVKGSLEAVKLHLLDDILSNFVIKDGKSDLQFITFLESLCGQRVHFVQRETPIQDRFIALWPDEKCICETALKLYKEAIVKAGLSPSDEAKLNRIAGYLRRTVLMIHSRDRHAEEVIRRFKRIRRSINKLIETLEIDEERRKVIRRLVIKLGDFKNDISIVFQNRVNTESDNVLFLGDFGTSDKIWNQMKSGFCDSKPTCLYPKYHIVKVTHHGTEDHYKWFKKHLDKFTDNHSIFLIPNGGYKKLSLYEDYSCFINDHEAKAVCSSCDSCETVEEFEDCMCLRHKIVFPKKYVDIS